MPGVEAKVDETAGGESPAAVFACPEILKKRADFLACARARRQHTPGFVVQGRRRAEGGPVRVGFTCSKKVGNAVARNRAKRRLREIARAVLPEAGRPGWDYVLIGRAGETAARDFALMQDELRAALAKLHG
ncbi:ribonuclease P protein component [Vannielia litorea]|uniref:ribonuclease P protein component n=1 Tax=Vannielia litorea TaxID=1217970 RepID=UPI001BCC81EA|nr:ribonuclease P protein component [Vannielia litorea]MBS8227041.1 ribonuclease P protein component [Vannielia litorea]